MRCAACVRVIVGLSYLSIVHKCFIDCLVSDNWTANRHPAPMFFCQVMPSMKRYENSLEIIGSFSQVNLDQVTQVTPEERVKTEVIYGGAWDLDGWMDGWMDGG